MKVVLSHSTKDKEFVQRLTDAFTGAGFTPGFATWIYPALQFCPLRQEKTAALLHGVDGTKLKATIDPASHR